MTGQKPASREQLGVAYLNGLFYMFGGASQQSYNDIKALEPSKYEWKDLNPGGKGPEERFGHSFNVFNDFLVMFGGAGLYNQEIKKRHTFDDLLIFHTSSNQWLHPSNEKLAFLATPGSA